MGGSRNLEDGGESGVKGRGHCEVDASVPIDDRGMNIGADPNEGEGVLSVNHDGGMTRGR